MKSLTILLTFCFLLTISENKISASSSQEDSLKAIVETTKNAEEKFEALFQLHSITMNSDSTQSVQYANEARKIALEMNDEVKEARILKDFSKKYIMAYDFQTYDSLLNICAPIFKKHDERKLYADCLNNLGASQYYRGNLSEAEMFFRQALDYYNPEDKVYLSTSLNIVFIMQTQGRYSESLKLLIPLTNKFHEIGDDYNYANCLVCMANVYSNQGDKEKAEEYNLLYIEKCKEIGFNDGVAGGYYNLANLYYEKGEYDKALNKASLAKEIFISNQNDYELSNVFIFIGVIYKDLGEFEKARFTNEESRKIAQKNGFSHHLSLVYSNNSNLSLIEGNNIEAKELSLKAFKIAKENESYKMMRDASFNIYESCKNLGEYKNALKYHEIHTQYKDSVEHKQNSRKVQALKMNFEITTKEYENEKLTTENQLHLLEINQQKTKLHIIGIFLILVTGIVVMLILLNKKLKTKNLIISKQKDELNKSNNLKDYMFSIIAHDLRGPVGNVKGLLDFLNIESAQNDQEGFNKILETVQKASSSTFELLENLLTWARQQKNEIEFQPKNQDIKELIENVIQLKTPAIVNKNIILKDNIVDSINCNFDYDMINLVVRNLVDNAIKFTPQGGEIKIEADAINDNIQISIADSGVGISDDIKDKLFNKFEHYTSFGTKNERGSGLGLKICHEFIARHSGQIWIDSIQGKGSTFSFTIPMS